MKPLPSLQKMAIAWMEKANGVAVRLDLTQWEPLFNETRRMAHSTMQALERKGLVKWTMQAELKRGGQTIIDVVRAELVRKSVSVSAPIRSPGVHVPM